MPPLKDTPTTPGATDNEEIEDAMSLQDEDFIDDVIEIPATSEDLQTFDEAAREEEEEEEENETEEVRNCLCNCYCDTGNLFRPVTLCH